METTNIVDFTRRDKMTDALTELLRAGAQDLIAQAVEAEFSCYMAQFSQMRTQAGHAAVVRNGYHPERPFQTGIGPVNVRIPKVRSKDGTPVTFRSALVPPYVRRTKTLEAALPWLYLKGISSGEMAPALKVLLGPDAQGLSANTVSRLKRDWAKEYQGWRDAALDDEPIVYIWADGVHSGLRGEDDKLCALVIVGVTARGKKRFLAIEGSSPNSAVNSLSAGLRLRSWRRRFSLFHPPLSGRTTRGTQPYRGIFGPAILHGIRPGEHRSNGVRMLRLGRCGSHVLCV